MKQKYVIALYIRLSVEDFKTESLSIPNQKLLLREKAMSLQEWDNSEVLEFIDTADYVFRVVFERGIQDVKVVWNIKRRVSAFRGGGIRPFVIDLAVWQMDTASLKERQRNEMGAGTAGEFYKDGF